MVLLNDSLTVVLVGDWNKLYTLPGWMADNIFMKEEIEIGVNGQGSDFTLSYRGNGITVVPDQSKMVFSATTIDDDEAIDNLCSCLNHFVEKAYTPQLFAYGINCDFVESEGILFAEVLDSMSDTNAIVENGYEIISTKVSRTLKGNDKVINMDSNLEDKKLKIHFNEHHMSEESRPHFDVKDLKGFIEECNRILSGLGYEIEGDE